MVDTVASDTDYQFPDPVGLTSVSSGYLEGCNEGVVIPSGLDEALERAATEQGVDPRVLSTTIWRESGCRRDALGSSGEIGLTQVHPRVWTSTLIREGIIKRESDLWRVGPNLQAGAFVLAYCQNRHGDLRTTFRCYNGSGPMAERYAASQIEAYRSAWGS